MRIRLTASLTKTEDGGRRLGALTRSAVGWASFLSPRWTPSKSSSGLLSETEVFVFGEVGAAGAT